MHPQMGFWLRLCTGSGPVRETEGAGIRGAHAWYSPGEVLVTDHMPRNGRVPGWSHLGRDGVGRLVFNAAQVTQTGVMAYVVVSQG